VKTRPTRGLDGSAGRFRPAGSSAASGQAGLEAKRAAGSAGPKIRKKYISEFNKALEICRRRFRRNFDMRILP
jgi:hypothetical protein